MSKLEDLANKLDKQSKDAGKRNDDFHGGVRAGLLEAARDIRAIIPEMDFEIKELKEQLRIYKKYRLGSPSPWER